MLIQTAGAVYSVWVLVLQALLQTAGTVYSVWVLVEDKIRKCIVVWPITNRTVVGVSELAATGDFVLCLAGSTHMMEGVSFCPSSFTTLTIVAE